MQRICDRDINTSRPGGASGTIPRASRRTPRPPERRPLPRVGAQGPRSKWARRVSSKHTGVLAYEVSSRCVYGLFKAQNCNPTLSLRLSQPKLLRIVDPVITSNRPMLSCCFNLLRRYTKKGRTTTSGGRIAPTSVNLAPIAKKRSSHKNVTLDIPTQISRRHSVSLFPFLPLHILLSCHHARSCFLQCLTFIENVVSIQHVSCHNTRF